MGVEEILKIAAVNTGLGMGVVFAMLTLISAVIGLFRFIPQKAAPAKAEGKKTEPAKREEDDLMPAIIAAVLAAAGKETEKEIIEDGYIVRAVRRRS